MVHRIVDANAKSVNSTKTQHERKIGKVTRANEIRNEILKKLKEEIREIKVNNLLGVLDMNEDINSKIIQEFMIELGLYHVFGEVNDVEEKNREATCRNGSKCTYFALRIEGVMKIVNMIELIECNEIVDSDHRGYLTDINLEA